MTEVRVGQLWFYKSSQTQCMIMIIDVQQTTFTYAIYDSIELANLEKMRPERLDDWIRTVNHLAIEKWQAFGDLTLLEDVP